MRLASVIVVLTILYTVAACAPRVANKQVNIIAIRPHYVVAQHTDSTHFIIYADNAKYAQYAAEEILNCNKTPCIIAPAGSIFAVHRPEVK